MGWLRGRRERRSEDRRAIPPGDRDLENGKWARLGQIFLGMFGARLHCPTFYRSNINRSAKKSIAELVATSPRAFLIPPSVRQCGAVGWLESNSECRISRASSSHLASPPCSWKCRWRGKVDQAGWRADAEGWR